MTFEAAGLSKRFGGNVALASVDFAVEPGRVHGLVGANGAGKSTLVKILSGSVRPDEGSISIGSWTGRHLTPRLAQDLGVATIHQDPALAPTLGLVENILLGHESTRARVFLDTGRQRRDALECLDRVGLAKPARMKAFALTPADQTLLEIAKALFRQAKTVIMDEPTASLGAADRQRLFTVVRNLRDSGVGIVYISHHLDEILNLTDVVTVLRDGQTVRVQETAESTEHQLIDAMIGHELTPLESRVKGLGPIALKVQGISQAHGLRDISFTLSEGEVLGVTGLVGSGRSRLARVLFGLEPTASGQMELFGEPYSPKSPAAAIRRGVGLVPEDRKRDALLMHLSAAKNISIPRLPVRFRGWLRLRREAEIARNWISRLDVHPPSAAARPVHLSGGNQQKLVIARWINAGSRVVILDEPGQGVDVGAREHILRVVRDLADRGAAILLISQELEELREIADRVLVMRNGRIAGELAGHQVCDAAVIPLAMGSAPKALLMEVNHP